LNSSAWIGIYVPLFIIFFIILPLQREIQRIVIVKTKKRKGVIKMMNEIIAKYIGKTCKISSGSLGTTVTGKIIDVKENWIEVQTKKGSQLINADFVQNIQVKS
jgi:hypothetical protein